MANKWLSPFSQFLVIADDKARTKYKRPISLKPDPKVADEHSVCAGGPPAMWMPGYWAIVEHAFEALAILHSPIASAGLRLRRASRPAP